MEETGEKSTTSLTREGVPDRKRRTNSQHVELVIARVAVEKLTRRKMAENTLH
jgi:hypothetical protein